MSLSKHTHINHDENCMVKIRLSSFSIQVYDEKKCCEECGVEYNALYNFCMIGCCDRVMRVCNTCNWETIPCLCCKNNNVGDIILSKKKNHCDVCAEQKLMFREINRKIKSNI